MSDAVRLKYALRGHDAGGGFTVAYTSFAVRVRNVAYLKDVAIHYTIDDHPWKDFPLAFASHHGRHDEFHGTIPEPVSRFVVRYHAAGTIWFDNNGGADYRFDEYEVAIGGSVALHRATAKRGRQGFGGGTVETSWMEGELLVANRSYGKEVGVRVSADGGATWHDTNGTWAGDTTANGLDLGPGGEVWRFGTPEFNLNPASAFRFAAYHRNLATGDVHWDNNFDQDYTLATADGATVG